MDQLYGDNLYLINDRTRGNAMAPFWQIGFNVYNLLGQMLVCVLNYGICSLFLINFSDVASQYHSSDVYIILPRFGKDVASIGLGPRMYYTSKPIQMMSPLLRHNFSSLPNISFLCSFSVFKLEHSIPYFPSLMTFAPRHRAGAVCRLRVFCQQHPDCCHQLAQATVQVCQVGALTLCWL